MNKKIIFILAVLIVIVGGATTYYLRKREPIVMPTRVIDVGSTQYLLFQEFTGGNDGTGVFHQITSDQAQLKSFFEDYISKIQNKLQTSALSAGINRKYGFSIGPLTLDQSDQELSATINTAFDVAIEKNVAVAFHFDVTHFWKNAKNPDGTRLSDGTGIHDNREWKDWNKTIADKDMWDNEKGIMPSMCFECDQVKVLVDHIARNVIAPAIKAGIDRLHSSGKQDLFAGVIIGWEAGSNNPLGRHSLTLKGYNSAVSLAVLHKAQQQILHDYLERWAKLMADNGIPREKLYTHTTNFSQFDMDYAFSGVKDHLGERGYFDWLLTNLGNGTDSFWEPFNDYSNAGFSIYVNSSQEGIFEAIYAEAAKHSGSWAESEGTNTTIEGKPSEINWETYLGKIFNHGGTLANIFGGFLGAHSGGYGMSTESQEAVAAYQKFLRGENLIELK